jgi:hypothetical protein
MQGRTTGRTDECAGGPSATKRCKIVYDLRPLAGLTVAGMPKSAFFQAAWLRNGNDADHSET